MLRSLDLLASPNTSSFASMLWIIPVLALVTYWGQSFVMQKLQPTQQQGAGQGLHEGHDVRHAAPVRILGIHHAGSCRFLLDYFRAGRFCTDAHHAQVFFSPEQVSAKSEASRYVTLLQADRKVKPLPANLQKQIADKIEAKNQAQAERQAAQKEKESGR